MLTELRIFFEAKPDVNHTDEEFKKIALPFTQAGMFSYGGYIAMDAMEKVHGRMEPVYQLIAPVEKNTIAGGEGLLEDTEQFLKKNPQKDYVLHLYAKRKGDWSGRTLVVK